jgi:DNA-binding response OmpR family regulator
VDLQSIHHALCSENQKVRNECYKLGAQDYLTKPFNPEELDELVKKNFQFTMP